MQRYFVSNDNIDGDNILIKDDDDDAHHINRVMRNKLGDSLVCVDQNQNTYRCSIQEIYKDKIVVIIKEKLDENTESRIDITLYQAILKSDKMDWIIQKGTEIGVNSFVPIQTSHSIARINKEKSEKKINRWQKIAKEAAEQSRRNKVPEIKEPLTFDEVLADISKSDTLAIMAYERSQISQGILSLLNNYKQAEKLAIIIGPEGGFSPEEVNKAIEKGIQLVNLGPRILRAETASIVAASGVLFYYGELGAK